MRNALTRRAFVPLLPAAPAALSQSVDREIEQMARNAPLAMKFGGSTASECSRWQDAFRSKLRSLLGDIDPPARWTTVTESFAEGPDHTRQTLLMQAQGQRDLPVHLLTPKGTGKRAAVLALHGHGIGGYDPVAGIAATDAARAELAKLRYGYGLELVRRGYVVAVPCFTPFGRRLGDPAPYRGQDPCGVTFVRMQLLGRVLMGENLRDALWALEMLARHDRTDPARIGCVGLSYGGRMTMLTAAMSPRIRAAVCSGALNVMQERILGIYGCGAQVIPGLLAYGDVPEIASLIAPRPCVWEIGRRDPLMVKDWIEPSLARMRAAWRAFGKADNLIASRHDGAHEWYGEVAYPVLEQALRA